MLPSRSSIEALISRAGKFRGSIRMRLAQRGEGAVRVVEPPPDRGQVQPAGNAGGVGGDQPQQQRLRRGEVAGAHGLHGRLVQASGILGHGDRFGRCAGMQLL